MRYKIVISIFAVFWIILLGRIYQVSINSNYYYENLAKKNSHKTIPIPPLRGEIYDRNGELLAINQIGFSISLEPHLKSDEPKLLTAIKELKNNFNDLNESIMLKVYVKNNSYYNHDYIKVVDFIPYNDMIGAYASLSLNQVIKIEAESKRYYPYGKYTSHIVGYTGKSNKEDNKKDPIVAEVGKVGKTGIEKYYNEFLEGELGFDTIKVNAINQEIEKIEHKDPFENRDLKLNIDSKLQKMIYERFGDDAGAVVVMKTNGEVLAAVSAPSFDSNDFVGGISYADWQKLLYNADTPFTNKFLNGLYPPGSTIKMGMALAFENSVPGTLDKNEFCKGYIEVGANKQKFRCWNLSGHGNVDLRKAIRESCDVYFYNKSMIVGINDMSKNLKEFGLGVETGVDLPHESSGIMPDKKWKMKRYKKPWYFGETINSSIGQGYTLVTPIEIARYTAMLATSKLPTPRVAKDEKVKFATPNLSTKHLKIIQEGMYDVCNSPGGTALRYMSHLPIIVAGKTGTSQVVSLPKDIRDKIKEEDMEYYHRSHAWLTTYAPYNNPKIIVTVIVEHGGHGGSSAGPIAADIYKWLHKQGYFNN
ncbi:MAG: penicillin-binding protein 2 [Campylobacterales bacterium]|nr:penicillin-binding protein 2 [Campylobacterales bacterium]